VNALVPEQDFGAKWLRDRRVAMLADRVGFGKTAQIVVACELVRANRITVISPPKLRTNTKSQFEQWAIFGWPVQIVTKETDELRPDGVVACSYDLARRGPMKARLRKRGADVLALDEAHALKSASGVTAKAILAKGGIAETAARTWFVTGTPTPNHAGEWYVFAKACGAWRGTYWEFVDRYCVVIDGHFGKKIVGSKAETRAELLAMLAPFVLARDKVEDGRPPLEIDTIAVDGAVPDFTGIDPAVILQIEAALAAEDWTLLDGPSVSTVRQLVGVAKAKACAEMIAYEMSENQWNKALVFCQHTAVIDTIAATVPNSVVIDGRTSAKAFEAAMSSFRPDESGPHRVAVCQWQALREGATMTQADRVFLVEPAWTPDYNKQMIARASRRGQTRPVRASFMHLPGSLDEAVTRTQQRKVADIELISIRS
jgi:SWI/SNF-related matrix-associated actin-dependent regulator of chromatin subfamily A-like protein 1